MNDTTSGSGSREARALDDPVMGFELAREVALLREEPGYGQFGRSSKTLGKSPPFRLVVLAARAGTSIGNEEADDAMAIHVLDGTVSVRQHGSEIAQLGAGDIVGEAAIVNHSLRTASIVALTPLEMIHFTDEAVRRLCDEMPSFQSALEAVALERFGNDQAPSKD